MERIPDKISNVEHVRRKFEQRRTMALHDRSKDPCPEYEIDNKKRIDKFKGKGLSRQQNMEIGLLNTEIYTKDMTLYEARLDEHTLRLAPFDVRESVQYHHNKQIEKLQEERNELLNKFNAKLQEFGL